MAQFVLIVSPHPDDEAIGCGGTIARHVAEGDHVRVLFLTSGENGGHGRPPAEMGPIREQEARAAAQVLGVEAVLFWRLTDGGVQVTAELVRRLREMLTGLGVERIYVPHPAEWHPDHQAAAMLVRAAIQGLSVDVLGFEVWTPLTTIDEKVDITPFVERKRAAIKAHGSQCELLSYDEAALGLARYRGELHNWPTRGYAEVFQRLGHKWSA